MTLDEVTAVGAIVGAIGSTIAAIVGVATWVSGALKTKRERIQADQADWTIRLYDLPEEELTARLEYSMRRPLQMISIRVLSPRGAKLQYYNKMIEPGSGNALRRTTIQLVGTPARFLVCRKLLEGRSIDAGTIVFRVYVPERPFWSRSDSTRLRIEVKAEATTAGRRQSTIIVTSDATPWTAKQTASTT